MTLRQQFDDIMMLAEEIIPMEGEQEFIESVVESTIIKDAMKPLEKKICGLKMAVAKMEKKRNKLLMKIKNESSRLEDQRKRTKAVEKERDELAAVLEEIRSVVMERKVSNPELLSLMDTASFQDSLEDCALGCGSRQ